MQDVKDIKMKRDARFLNSLFQDVKEVDDQHLSNKLYVQVLIKAIISPENIASMEHIKEQAEDYQNDDVIGLNDIQMNCSDNEDLGMRKEFSVFVERDMVASIELLNKNYIEKQDVIKIPVCGASGIRLPEEADFQLYFQFKRLSLKAAEQTILVQDCETRTIFGLLICGCIFKDHDAQDVAYTLLMKRPSMEIIFKLLLITVQYESLLYAPKIYKLVRSILYHQAGMLERNHDSLLIQLLETSISVVRPNFMSVKTSQHILTINTTFLYPIMKQFEGDRNHFLKPLDSYTLFQVVRNFDVDNKQTELLNQYPHIYQIKLEGTQCVELTAIQSDDNSDIQIYKQLNQRYAPYDDNYVGCVRRSWMGTSFELVDDGYPKKYAHCFPEWIASPRRQLMIIEYETNILASKPRRFDVSFYNFESKMNDSLINLLPKYNAEKDCYQLHFSGRAKMASARNFQMVKEGDDTTVYLLHGKARRNVYNLDFRPPLNILQAFTISMVSISSKILVQ